MQGLTAGLVASLFIVSAAAAATECAPAWSSLPASVASPRGEPSVPTPGGHAGMATKGTQVPLPRPGAAPPPPDIWADAVAATEPLVALIDLSEQRMAVYVDSRIRFRWVVSTGAAGFETPTGSWHAYLLSPNHRSSIYNNAPMPWAVFFFGGYAIHGTLEVDQLGHAASHGCVRLAPENARTFFELVKAAGLASTLVWIIE